MASTEQEVLGIERAAIFLLTIGEQEASEIFKYLEPKEVQKVGAAMATLKNVSSTQVGKVMDSFTSVVDSQTSIGIGSDDYIRNTLQQALGEDKAQGIIDRVLYGANTKGLESLKWMDPRAVADMIGVEHPQIIAIVLAYLDSDQAAEILQLLPDKVRIDVVLRLATLDSIQPSALNELNEVLEKNFTNNSNATKSSRVGGVKTTANIINLLDTSVEKSLMDEIRETDEHIAEEIEELMFVFEDLGGLDDRSMQTLLRDVNTDQLVVALKGASNRVKEKIFTNMSQRAGDLLKDDMEVKGPIKVSEMEAAQKEIVMTARKLAEDGQIALGAQGGGDDYV